MRRQLYEVQRAMRARREAALRRGVIAVLDIGTSKVACLVLQIVFTKLKPKLAGEDAQALYWPHPLDALKAPGWPGILNYKVLASIVIVSMLILYTIFR